MRRFLAAFAISLSLTGCMTMSGLDGGSTFSCKAPDGVTCSSLFGIYTNAVADNLPGMQKKSHSGAAAIAAASSESNASPAAVASNIRGRAPSAGMPIRSTQKVMRIWVAPFEDNDGDLHDQSYVYMVADIGRWNIEHSQRRIVDRYRPTFAPQGAQTARSGAPLAKKEGGSTSVSYVDGQGATPQLPPAGEFAGGDASE